MTTVMTSIVTTIMITINTTIIATIMWNTRLAESSKSRREFREQWGDNMPSSKEARLRATASSQQQAQESSGLHPTNLPTYSSPSLEVGQEQRRAPRNLFDDI